MTMIEVFCKGRALRDGGYAHTDNVALVCIFEGDETSQWHLTGEWRQKLLAHLQGDEYISPRRGGELGAAEAARRFGTPTDEQQRLLAAPARMNFNLPCGVCPQKLTRHWEDIQRGLQQTLLLARQQPTVALEIGIEPRGNDMAVSLQLLSRLSSYST
ncbi:hypothetical protein [Mycolicibacterium mengxianglii]|uniref:hypothetical protein n=1 Tax=Mycolicibacterium mengxianglii TaxID=2736649 RepID=UPI0018EEFB09|nr:hypothetical protein [Mycolicibacterium mengxianglii]